MNFRAKSRNPDELLNGSSRDPSTSLGMTGLGPPFSYRRLNQIVDAPAWGGKSGSGGSW